MIGDSRKLDELGPKTIETAFYRGTEPEGSAAGSYVDLAEALKGDGPSEKLAKGRSAGISDTLSADSFNPHFTHWC